MAECGPVGRLRPLGIRFAVCMAIGAGGLAIFAALSPRPDLARQFVLPRFMFEIVGFAAASGLLAVLALRGAVPGQEPGAGTGVLALGLLALAAVSAFGHPRDLDVLVDAFVRAGIPCARAMLGLALVPGLAFFVALRRGVPLAPARSGALAGAAALLLAHLAMRLHCPVDEGWHLLVWHGLPIVPAVALGALLGGVWLSRWQS